MYWNCPKNTNTSLIFITLLQGKRALSPLEDYFSRQVNKALRGIPAHLTFVSWLSLCKYSLETREPSYDLHGSNILSLWPPHYNSRLFYRPKSSAYKPPNKILSAICNKQVKQLSFLCLNAGLSTEI